MNRGRPRHDDILTPREWDVLALLREDLTYEEIGDRLGIAHNTVKYHVSEILTKLGVNTREEAAAWSGRPRGVFGIAPFLPWLGESAQRRIATLVLGAAAGAAALLAIGLVVMQARGGAEEAATTEPTPTPAPGAPAFAPDGRTGDPAIDAIIDGLVTAGASTLATRYSGVEVTISRPHTALDTETWTSRLADSRSRSLYGVARRDSQHVILIEAVSAAGTFDGWNVLVDSGRVQEIYIRDANSYGLDPGTEDARFVLPYAPDVARDYGSYIVLPPQDELPDAPRAHPLSTRTDNPAVDRLLAAFEAGDADVIRTAVATPDAFRVRQCQRSDSMLDSMEEAAYVDTWAQRIVTQVTGVESVARVPEGYPPAADHVIVLQTQVDEYWWQAEGVLVRDSRIAGLVAGEGCTYLPEGENGEYVPSRIAPGDRNYLIAPPDNLDGLEASRASLRSGVPHLDAILAALEARDEAALQDLIELTAHQCGEAGFSPPCPPGVAPGTAIDVFPVAACNGGVAFSDHPSAGFLVQLMDRFALYAVAAYKDDNPWDTTAWPQEEYLIVLSSPDERGSEVLGVGSAGILYARGTCGYEHPEWLIPGGAPDYLLLPP